MIKAFKTALALVLTLALLLSATACGEYKAAELGDLSLSVLKNMRKTDDGNYDICFSTLECMVGAQEITAERLEKMGLAADATLEQATNSFIERNGIDRSQCELTYDEDMNAYKMRYSVSFDGEAYYFHYNIFIGGSERMYFIDMICDYGDSSYYIIEFEKMGKLISCK